MPPAALVDKSLRHAQHDLLHSSMALSVRTSFGSITRVSLVRTISGTQCSITGASTSAWSPLSTNRSVVKRRGLSWVENV